MLLITIIFSLNTALAQKININIDIQSAKSITSLLSQKTVSDQQLDQSSKLYGNQQLIQKVKGYSGSGEDIFKSTLKEIIQTGTIKGVDPYNWKKVKSSLGETKQLLSVISANKALFGTEIAKLIQPYTAPSLQVSVRAYFLVGGGSLGFTIGSDNTFNVALHTIGNDLDGLKLLIAHELYHSIQGAGQQTRQKLQAEKPTYNEKATYALIYNLWSEGSANFVGDFKTITKPKSFSAEQIAIDKKNSARIRTSFYLLETILYRCYKDTTVKYQQLYNIGFTTEFDEVFYSVGNEMAKQLLSHKGSSVLANLVNSDPLLFMQEYIALYQGTKDDNLIKFSPSTEHIVANMVKWKDKI